LGAGLGVIPGVAPALADSPARVAGVAVQGDAVVGATLTASAVVSGAPAPTIAYAWARCDATQPDRCSTIGGATAASYTVTGSDLGQRLVARVIVKNKGATAGATSAPSAVVGAGSGPTAATDPMATPPANTVVAIDFLTAPVPAAARYLQPFPVVRVAGSSVRGGAFIDLFRVAAPHGTRVAISCRGRGCPIGQLSRGPGRVRQLERFLPAGVEVTIRASRRGYIGKYARFVVRSHAAPKRRDACLLPGSARPAPCP
jgi:hypothetical protein